MRYIDPTGEYGYGIPCAGISCLPFDWERSKYQIYYAAGNAKEMMCDGFKCTAKCSVKVLIGDSAGSVAVNAYKEYVMFRLKQTAKAVAKKALSYAVAGLGLGLAAKDLKDGVECTINCVRE